jgi:ribosomal protein S18 acetylase RimI-like enzyme
MIHLKKNFIYLIPCITITCASIMYPKPKTSMLLHQYKNHDKIYLTESDNPKINTPILNGLDAFNTTKTGIIKFDHCTIVIKDENKKAIAGATCDICKSPTIGEVCELNGIWVDEQHKNENLDTYIMNSLLDHISNKHCSIVQIEVHGIQHISEAKKFYEQFGFVTNAIVPELGNIETYIMRLPLNKRILVQSPPITYKMKLKTSRNKHSNTIDKQIHNFSNATCSVISEQPYTIFITTHKEKIIAGVIGNIIEYANIGRSCKVSTVWVDEHYRGNGLGKKIMDELIHYAKNKNCKNIHLETYEWQAKPFYEKCGFTTVAVAPNVQKMRGMEQYYMRKMLQ